MTVVPDSITGWQSLSAGVGISVGLFWLLWCPLALPVFPPVADRGHPAVIKGRRRSPAPSLPGNAATKDQVRSSDVSARTPFPMSCAQPEPGRGPRRSRARDAARGGPGRAVAVLTAARAPRARRPGSDAPRPGPAEVSFCSEAACKP